MSDHEEDAMNGADWADWGGDDDADEECLECNEEFDVGRQSFCDEQAWEWKQMGIPS